MAPSSIGVVTLTWKKAGMLPGTSRMIRQTRRRRKLKLVRLASLAALLLVSVALLGFGVRQLFHLGFR